MGVQMDISKYTVYLCTKKEYLIDEIKTWEAIIN